jgi:hypothetical protein
MPTPTQQTDYATRLPKLLTSRYVNAPVVSGLAKAFAGQAQGLENSIFDLLSKIGNVFQNGPPAAGPWDFIDKYGAIVGITRDGRDDVDFWAAILVQIAINTSNGHPNDFLRVAQLVTSGTPVYYEWPPGAFEIDLFDISASTVLALIQYLGKARPGGVAGNLRFATDAGPYVTFPSAYGGVTGLGFVSHYGGATGGELVALEVF